MDFLHFLAQYRTNAGDIFFQFVTYAAQELFVVGIICWLFWCANKKLAYTLGFSYFTSGLLVQGLKITFRIPRPWALDPSFHAVESAVPGATGYSFPSGHTQSSTALFGTTALHTPKHILKILSVFAILLVGFSRMYLGCHTPKDVFVSLFLSFICVFLCYHYIYRKDSFQKHPSVVVSIMFLVCAGLALYAVFLNKSNIIDLMYAQDCLKASGAGTAFALGYYIETTRIHFSIPHTFKEKLMRLVTGLIGTLLILEGLKPFIGTSLFACFIRYFLAVIWILAIYPLLFTKFSHTKE